ncbi:response regulator [Phycicoccus duodecadis]|uniref:LuxR family two component transcriptional regulator n=1 Tax=Phycicoccus duodecadis TaxID=173053 RepID=A0A2N3YJZ0_9MICO|nr:response regulator transcription factor [Phycicoccus duodecadis]PKW27164.1 LuxR family two component transcriptional regulator [Phycicoccus duodecadis]
MSQPTRDVPGGHDGRGPRGIRVVIADDHQMYRQGMAIVVELDGVARVVGQASTGDEAVETCLRLHPDVVLMDVRMPGVGGIDACRRLHSLEPDIRILMLTMSDDEGDLFEAIKAGASGYLLKDLPGEEVSEAIRRVHDGQAIIPPGMAATLLQEFSRLAQEEPAGADDSAHLTEREVEVLRLVARGLANREIADELGIAENTVKNHVRNILEKLHIHSRVEAAVYAHRQRLMPTDE